MKFTITTAIYIAAIAITSEEKPANVSEYRGKCVIERYQERHVNDCVISLAGVGVIKQ